jgi:peroxiredoxin
VVAVSVESPETLAELASALGLEFKLLSDTDRRLIDALGLRHTGGHPMDGSDIGRPATLLVRGGTVRERHATHNWRVRPDPLVLARALGAME